MRFDPNPNSNSSLSVEKRMSIDLELYLEKAKRAELDRHYYLAGEFYMQAGYIRKELGYANLAILDFEQASLNYKKEEDWRNYLKANDEQIFLYKEQELTDSAIRTQIASLSVVKRLKDLEQEFKIQFEIGQNFQVLMDFESALKQYQTSLTLAEQLHDKSKINLSVFNLGNIYNWLNKYELAEELLLKGINTLDLGDDLKTKLYFYGSYGILLSKLRKLEDAEYWFLKVLKEVEGKEDFDNLKFNILKSKGILYFNWKRYEDAISALKEAEEFGKNIRAYSIHSLVYEFLSKSYEELGDYKSSVIYFKKHFELHQRTTQQSINVREKNIMLRYEMEDAKKDTELFRLKNIDLALAYKEIETQKEEIEQKNKNITESIEYARNIQEGILPDLRQFQIFKESFVLYRPKDIIGGDFYWLANKGSLSILAVADCTGHGVPGALMSMIGHNLLNQAVNEKELVDPGEILYFLHEGIHRIFNQNRANRRTYDGMDISLITIDRATKNLFYAGAMRPMYYVRQGELNRLDPNKNPIGGIEGEEAVFSTQVLAYLADDTFYLFSDGYADQFGGPNGRKFMMKRFKETLLEVAQYPLTRQMELLEHELNDWKGFLEQVDDILIIGIKID
ncbi:MAG: SpoIIE family protein phosphatase [Bacteroidia bacterium]|nr:SpoIIE family protein phosphatase [Bacteroidia bacterium]